jgi:predicted transcriptional regulator
MNLLHNPGRLSVTGAWGGREEAKIADLTENDRLLAASGRLVAAYVGYNPVAAGELTALLVKVHQALKGLSASAELPIVSPPAVPVRRSIHHDRIICLQCGLGFKSLKRHLHAQHDLNADEYRAKWGLPGDYPMVAPDYATRRSELAKSFGLGRKPAAKAGRSRRA